MDDGQQVKKGGITLCTDSYKPEEIGVLRKALLDNFSLVTSIHKKKRRSDPDSTYERIYVNKQSLDTIKENLKEHMDESMLYKLNIAQNSSEGSSTIVQEIELKKDKYIPQDTTDIVSDSDSVMDIMDID